MQPPALIMMEETARDIPNLLAEHGIDVKPYHGLKQMTVFLCQAESVRVLLSISQPTQWANVEDLRKHSVVVALVGVSILRFWRFGREKRLCQRIVEILLPTSWSADS